MRGTCADARAAHALQIAAENVPPGRNRIARSGSGELSKDGHRPPIPISDISPFIVSNMAARASPKL